MVKGDQETIVKKRILITGGAGFIGTHLSRALARSGNQVTVLDLRFPEHRIDAVTYIQGDVRNRADLLALIPSQDVVFHLAAIVSVSLCEEDPQETFRTNTESTGILLELISNANKTRDLSNKIRFIFSSSSAVYGDIGKEGLKISEAVDELKPLSHYGRQKLESERLVYAAARQKDVPSVIFRFFNVYGPGQKADSPYSGVISLFVRYIRENRDLPLNGGGYQTRDFVSVHDVVRALVRASEVESESALSGLPINLGSAHAIQIKHLAELLSRASQKELSISEAPPRSGDILHSCADTVRAKKLLSWQPLVDLEEGVQELVQDPQRSYALFNGIRLRHFQSILFFVVTLFWIGFSFSNQADFMHGSMAVVFSLLTTLLLFWGFYGLQYFVELYPVPRLDSLITLIAITPASGIVAKYFVFFLFGVEILRFRQILLISPVVALLIFLIQLLAGFVFTRSGFKRKIGLVTSQEEGIEVRKALRAHGLLRHYELIDGYEIKKSPPPDDLVYVVISRSEVQHFKNQEKLVQAMLDGTHVIDYSELVTQLNGHLDLASLNLWMFLNHAVRKEVLGRIYYSWKTVFERIFSLCMLIVLAPLFVLVGLLIKLASPGPVFYAQTRLGFKGKEFKLWKFRSMRIDAESFGPQWSDENDSRVTRFGAFLRKMRIDELPQLWNVLRGEMSLIGPRPERPEFYHKLEKDIPLFGFRLLVFPGITGWAQVMGGYTSTLEQTKRKLEYDLFYLKNMSPKMDFIIIVKTVIVAFKSLFPGRFF